MALDIDIKNRIKKILYSRLIWIVILNIILIIVPIYSFNFLRSRDSRAMRQRSIATNDLTRTIRSYVKADIPTGFIPDLPIVAPYQNVIVVESETLNLIYETGWLTNYSIESYEYDFILNKMIFKIVGRYAEPTLGTPEIISRMAKYIKPEVRKFSIINYRYLYSIKHFKHNNTRYSVIVLTDKSDLMIDSRINKIVLFLITSLSIFLGIAVSFVYYRLLIRPLHILTKQVKSLSTGIYDPINIFTLNNRIDEIGILSQAFFLTSKELIDKKESFETFTNDVLHELKNPLTSIRNAAEILRSNRENSLEIVNLISKESGRIEKLLFDIKEYNDIDKIEGFSSFCEPSNIIKEILPIYFKSEIKINLKSSMAINLSQEQFVTVLTNLIDNAISFSPDPGSICINYYSKNDFTYLEVSDTGKGIKDEDKTKIFNRFYSNRINGSNKLHSGLGLSIVKTILDNYNHKIECLDNKPKGTIFRISFKK